ncbi:MAG: cysteine desulfurase [Elusimicrobia bacterium]|nr:cysteine desulfurase [Elusimicrobiota bacterium]
MKKPIYLDYNATTPHDPEVVEAMRPFLEEHFGNPSSSHAYGAKTKEAVETARRQAAALLNCRPEEIVFTSGGTESNNYALKGAAFALRDKGNHIITSQVEHPAVLEVCRFLERQGFKITYVPVDGTGRVRPSDVEQAMTAQTILISIMHANNEVGTLQPVQEIAALAKKRGVLSHTDAAQSAGKIPTRVDALGVDLLSVAGHKLYAPKGIGVLFVRAGVTLEKFMHGAGHESGRRAGTENVLEIAGLGKACEIALRDMEKNETHMRAMRDKLYEGLQSSAGNLRLNGHVDERLPNTLSVGFRGLEAHRLLSGIQDAVAASAGSACHSGEVKISPVLKAMNVPEEWARGTVRFSTGRMTTLVDIQEAVQVVSKAIRPSAAGGKNR